MVNAAVVQLAPETVPASAVARDGGKDASGESQFSDLLGEAVAKTESGAADQSEAPEQAVSDAFAFLLGTRADAASAIATLIGQPLPTNGQPVTIVPGDAAAPMVDPVTGSVRAWVASEIAIPDGNATPVDLSPIPATPDEAVLGVVQPARVGQSSSPLQNAPVEAAKSDPLLPLVASVSMAEIGQGQTPDPVQPSQAGPEQARAAQGATAEAPQQAAAAEKPGVQARVESNPIAGAPALVQQQAQETAQVQTNAQGAQTATAIAGQKTDGVVVATQSSDRPSTDSGSTKSDGGQSQAAGMLGRSDQLNQTSTEAAARADGATRPAADLHQQVIDQVVRSVSVQRDGGRTDMVVKLNPPDLGTLTIHLAQDASGMTSQIQATSDQVRGLLQAHLPALVDALSGVGVKLNSVQITTDQSFGAMMHNSAQESGHQQQQDNAPRSRYAGTSGASTVSLDPAIMAASSQGTASYSWLA